MIDLALVTGQEMHYSHGHLDEPLLPVFGERGLDLVQTLRRMHIGARLLLGLHMARRLLETGALIGLAPHPGFYETTFDRASGGDLETGASFHRPGAAPRWRSASTTFDRPGPRSGLFPIPGGARGSDFAGINRRRARRQEDFVRPNLRGASGGRWADRARSYRVKGRLGRRAQGFAEPPLNPTTRRGFLARSYCGGALRACLERSLPA